MILLQLPQALHECPSCRQQAMLPVVPFDGQVHTHFHPCPVTGMATPWVQVPEGQTELNRFDVRQVVNEREDYVLGERAQFSTTTGRPVMSISTERRDGSNDLAAFAPTATNR